MSTEKDPCLYDQDSEAGQFCGGTELRNLAGYRGKLYAGNGYWEDRPGPEGRQPAQVLVLDSPGAQWRVDRNFDEKLADGRWRHLAISALEGITFTTDGSGRNLAQPVSLLCAGTWDLNGFSQVFSREDSTGRWTAMTPASASPKAFSKSGRWASTPIGRRGVSMFLPGTTHMASTAVLTSLRPRAASAGRANWNWSYPASRRRRLPV